MVIEIKKKIDEIDKEIKKLEDDCLSKFDDYSTQKKMLKEKEEKN